MKRFDRSSVFTIASWLLPIVGALVTWLLYLLAVAHRRSGEWLPGIGELIVGTGIVAVCGFGCGIAAILRRERHWWAAVIPFFASLGAILYGSWNIFTP